MILILIIIAVSVTLINFLDVKKISTGITPPLWILPVLLIVTVCLPIVVILLCIFELYRECIGIILKIKYGERFAGLLNGPDAIHMASETLQNVINNVLIYQCPRNMSASEFYETLKERLRKAYVLPKFNVIFKLEFGYSYMLKEKSNFDIGFRKMELINTKNHKLSKTELMLLINKCANSHLPRDNTIPWEILVGSQPIEWRDDIYNYYFALCRYHHSIMDGEGLMKLTVASYADKENAAKISSEHASKRSSNVIMKLCKLYSETCLAFILIPSWFVLGFILRRGNKHILEGHKLSRQCHYAINVEYHWGYVQKVKRIKSKIPGVNFSAVLSTVISASLGEFFTKNSDFTEKINIVLPELPGSTKLLHLKQIELKDVKLQNNFSVPTLDLPICISNMPAQFDIISRLKFISKKRKALQDSSHYRINKLMENTVWACLPQQLLRYLLGFGGLIAILSFLPGISKVTCFDGSVEISDFLLWSTHGLDIGSSFLMYTYDGRLQTAVSIDKALIENYGDVQEITDNIFKYLDVLEEEISKCGDVLDGSLV